MKNLHNRIIQKRNAAIEKAKSQGKYNCCCDSHCTMCFMQANKWNKNQIGTCNCAGFLAQGEEPCPQCRDAIAAESSCSTESSCSINLE